MLNDNVPYRFHIRSDTPVLTHAVGETYNLRRGFLATNTEIPVIYHLSDLLFVPADFTYETLLSAARQDSASSARIKIIEKLIEYNNASEDDRAWLSHVLKYYYGFVLPENKRQIDVILVRENAVVAHSRSGKPITGELIESDLHRQKKMIRNVRRQKDHLW